MRHDFGLREHGGWRREARGENLRDPAHSDVWKLLFSIGEIVFGPSIGPVIAKIGGQPHIPC